MTVRGSSSIKLEDAGPCNRAYANMSPIPTEHIAWRSIVHADANEQWSREARSRTPSAFRSSSHRDQLQPHRCGQYGRVSAPLRDVAESLRCPNLRRIRAG